MIEPSDNANPRSCAYMHKIQLHGVENRKKKKSRFAASSSCAAVSRDLLAHIKFDYVSTRM